ncbi:MAG: hypothetical protein BWX84_01387 [Verrucomicrobia bacterium ADurb.Bin118]|nr:MAG: hypothetical protein BWX84_01387 [Verrucomicrobia bacterium ADurb.Bin118]
MRSPQKLMSWSSVEAASRKPPSALRAMAYTAAGSKLTCSRVAISVMYLTIWAMGMRRRSNR